MENNADAYEMYGKVWNELPDKIKALRWLELKYKNREDSYADYMVKILLTPVPTAPTITLQPVAVEVHGCTNPSP